MKRTVLKVSAAVILCAALAGLLFVGIRLREHSDPARLSFDTSAWNTIERNGKEYPLILTFSRQHVSFPVYPAAITAGRWGTTEKGVSFLENSAVPGEKGNSVFYGHNWPSLLGMLGTVSEGDRISVLLSNGTTEEFRVTQTALVGPYQTDVIGQTTEARLTVFTCAGLFDTKRLVVTAIAGQNGQLQATR